MSPSPSLPWEVIERVIDHSADGTKTLYSFALTCRQLRPRSTIILFRCIKPKTRDQLFALCAVLKTNCHLQPCVRSASVPVHEFSPHPLLRILPNLSEIEFTDIPDKERALAFHPSILKCCRPLGQHIRTLSLRNLLFFSLSGFSDALLLLPRIESLSCERLRVDRPRDHVHEEFAIQRLSKRLNLKVLTIGAGNDDIVLTLLREALKHELLTLVYEGPVGIGDEDDIQPMAPDSLDGLAREHEPNDEWKHVQSFFRVLSPSDWVHLTSFIWNPRSGGSINLQLKCAIDVLRSLHSPKLREVTMGISIFSLPSLLPSGLSSLGLNLELCAELESALMTFPQSTISFSVFGQPLNSRRHHSWLRTVERFFPALAGRHAVRIDAKYYSGDPGHDGRISTPIVMSADSRWAATGSSEDRTIIIWDIQRGCISQEWFTEDTELDCLAFSPDGRYVMSTGSLRGGLTTEGKWVTIWDLHQRGRRVGSLKADSNHGYPLRPFHCDCAWSPDGTWIAAGAPLSGVVQIWETTTFQPLHSASTWKGSGLLTSSTDGRWVVTTSPPRGRLDPTRPTTVWIWSVESGKLHLSLQGHADGVRAAAFNPGNTRIATGSRDSTVRIWDAQTGEQLLVLQERAGREIDTVAFSGNGGMVLSHSSDLSAYLGRTLYNDRSDAVKVWDAYNGASLASLSETRVHGFGTVRSTCFSPCGSYVATISDDKGALLWSTNDWSCIAEVSGGGAQVTRVAISRDGSVLCCGTSSGTVFLHHVHDFVAANRDRSG